MIFLNKLLRSKNAKKIRNFLNIKPSHFLFDYTSEGKSVSDAFFWRVDENFKTIFRYSDILNIFYNDKSSKIIILFYDNEFNLIKSYKNNLIKSHNSLIIDQKFLNLSKGFGSFYIFHETKTKLNVNIRNSCYTGYSFKNSIPSFVHGNLHSASKNFHNNEIDFGLGAKSIFKKFVYQVQNNMKFEKTEIMLTNNSNSTINVNIGDNKYELNKGHVLLNVINNNNIINIKSNSYLLRPIIFNYIGKFIDVYHG